MPTTNRTPNHSNKEAAISFLKLVASGEVGIAYDRYISLNFIHHNQYFKGDRLSLMAAMQEASHKSPNRSIEIKKIFEDGSTVITVSQVIRVNSENPDVAVVHIFRFQDEKVVELWDLGQQMVKDSPNENGVF